MERTCSNCGAVTPPEARFCRHCGAPLKAVATYGDNETISPLAQTVPLSGEGHTTSKLGADEDGGIAPETKRVVRAEMERLLRHSRFETAPDGKPDGDGTTAVISDYAAPPTGELSPASPAPVVPAPAHSAQRAPAATRSRRRLVLLTTLLLLATISGALLAYYLLRRRATPTVANVTSEANSNEANSNQSVVPVNANSPGAEAGVEQAATPDATPQPDVTPQPSPKPSASVEATREARARQEQERETVPPLPAGTPTPAPTASPAAQASPTQTTTTPAPTPAKSNGDAKAAQANSDTFYFQAVNLVNGREPRSLPRAELLRALQLFQNVVSGPHAAEARRQAARLGRELDRLNKQSQR